MRIGILTFQRAINYGAVLQAYALQQTLRGLGHEVWIIDYRQERVEHTDRRPFLKNDKWNLLKSGHLRSWWNYNKEMDNVLRRRARFDGFLNNYLCLTEPCKKNNLPVFDIYVIGSDQVWNSAICDGLDTVFWGDFPHLEGSKIISYAASTSIKDLQKHNHYIVQRLLGNFSHISVREKETCDYLNLHYDLNQAAITVLDPTLLAEKKIWDRFDNDEYKSQDYVLYFGARICNAYPNVLLDKATSLAKQYRCDVKCIEFNSDTPEDFVNKFRYAKAVITSSFHGVAFSLIFNRPLYAVVYGDEQDARYINILESIGGGDMLIQLNQAITPHNKDYNVLIHELSSLREESLKYLINLL